MSGTAAQVSLERCSSGWSSAWPAAPLWRLFSPLRISGSGVCATPDGGANVGHLHSFDTVHDLARLFGQVDFEN